MNARQRLRVLMPTARYFPFKGGIETHVHEVTRRLAARGVDVTVLTANPGGKLLADEVVEGVHVRRIRSWPDQEDFYFAPGIYGFMRNGSWDVVHCQGSHTFVPPLAMLAARHARLPYVVTFHTGAHSSHVRTSLRGVQWAALRPLFRRAAGFVAVSQFEANFFSRTLGIPIERFRWIPNGADLPAPDEGDRVDVGGPLILSVGRLERYKGHHRIIAALPHILEHCPEARLWLLGDGPYRDSLQAQTQALGLNHRVAIQTIPAEERRRMAGVLASARLVTLLSDGESHPVAVMEALALGRPVLVANTPGLSELAERGLVQAIPLESSPREVAAAALHQMSAPHTPPRVSLPTWDDCADQLLDLYEDVVSRRRSACAS